MRDIYKQTFAKILLMDYIHDGFTLDFLLNEFNLNYICVILDAIFNEPHIEYDESLILNAVVIASEINEKYPIEKYPEMYI